MGSVYLNGPNKYMYTIPRLPLKCLWKPPPNIGHLHLPLFIVLQISNKYYHQHLEKYEKISYRYEPCYYFEVQLKHFKTFVDAVEQQTDKKNKDADAVEVNEGKVHVEINEVKSLHAFYKLQPFLRSFDVEKKVLDALLDRSYIVCTEETPDEPEFSWDDVKDMDGDADDDEDSDIFDMFK